MDNMNFSRHREVEIGEDGTEIIVLSSDDDADSSVQNVFQCKTEIANDSFHDDNSNMDNESYCSEESDSDDFLNNLKTKHHYNEQTIQCANVQTESENLMDIARTSASSLAATLITSTTAPTMTQSSLPNSNYHNETQNLIDPQLTQIIKQLIDSTVKQHMQEAMNQLIQQFDLVPKGSKKNDSNSKALKQKRKHGHGTHSIKKRKLVRTSSESSTSTSKYPGKIKSVFRSSFSLR
jgi:hypothetical protein